MPELTVLLVAKMGGIFPQLRALLAQEDICTRQVDSWHSTVSCADDEPAQLIVLHCPGAGMGGLTLCQKVRASYSGLLVLVSDSVDEQFHVLALDLGAEASLTQNAGAALVAANVRALLRRFARVKAAPVQTFGALTVDANRRDVYVDGEARQLSTVEFNLLWLLVGSVGCVFSREEIHQQIYHTPYNGYDRNIDLYISRIRHKIGDDPILPRYLKTVRGVGYQFVGG
ncbi:MAG: response regulator transcription factor [Desulfuromonas sp.]|nr:response regulator transcription factor [Desulfuromonas sp.]